jgi:hypothetical protein
MPVERSASEISAPRSASRRMARSLLPVAAEGGCGATFVESLRLQRFIALGDQAIG